MKKTLMHIIKSLWLLILLALLTLIFIHIYQYYDFKYQYHPIIFKESNKEINNPYRGFYQMVGYSLNNDDNKVDVKNWFDKRINENVDNLVLLQINLRHFNKQNISNKALEQLDYLLSLYQDNNKQIILRFLYDWDDKAIDTEPDDINLIISHINQLAPTVNKYHKNVFIIQGNFTGNNGEMHSTKYSDYDSRQLLTNEMFYRFDSSIFLGLRTPSQIRHITKYYGEINLNNAYQNYLPSRLSLFNDGMLGSVYDLGTYDDTPIIEYEDIGTREEEIKYQNKICYYVPNGGEVVIDNYYNDLNNAIIDLNKMHVSYLNSQHDLNVLNKWQKTIYYNNDIYNGISGLEYIKLHLGYRYVLDSSTLSFDPYKDQMAKLKLSIRNSGFAPAYKLFNSYLIIKNINTNKEETIELNIDNRLLVDNEIFDFSTLLDIRHFDKGTYELFFAMKDKNLDLPIYFANVDNEDNVILKIGTLILD